MDVREFQIESQRTVAINMATAVSAIVSTRVGTIMTRAAPGR
jgi:hypothetical protein